MDEASKAWLNVQHFDTLTAPLYELGGKWRKIETSVTQTQASQSGTTAATATTASSSSSTSSATSASSSSVAGSAAGAQAVQNQNKNTNIVEITLHDVGHLSRMDCLVFQNWYGSVLNLYEVGPQQREKLILRDYRMVKYPSFETDQQSYFAIYRSQLDTTEFFHRSSHNRNVKLRAKLTQESPVWGQCSVRHIAAYRFEKGQPSRTEQDLLAAQQAGAAGAGSGSQSDSQGSSYAPSTTSGAAGAGGSVIASGATSTTGGGSGAGAVASSAPTTKNRPLVQLPRPRDQYDLDLVELAARFSVNPTKNPASAGGTSSSALVSESDPEQQASAAETGEIWDIVMATGSEWRR
ncbi:unnamed protein product [Amoebophrya sp. A120]|nr:unnamed protein product [Amoebophrya sp. A120]|eukprot:GSA120T00018518001.1